MYKIILLSLLIITSSLFANRKTEVLDAFDKIDPWDFNIEVEYKYNYQNSKLKREYYCNSSTSKDDNCQYEKMKNNGIVNANNFKYTKEEHIIIPKLRFGLYKNVELYLALPVYISSTRKLGFDKVARKSGMDENNDGTVDSKDNYTHDGAGNTLWNIKRTGGQDIFFAHKYESDYKFNTQEKMYDDDDDPETPEVPMFINPEEEFSGLDYQRSGLKTINLGFKWSVLDNDRDSSDPSWMLGVEYRIPVVSSMDYYTQRKLSQISNKSALGGTPYESNQVSEMLDGKIDLSNDTLGDGVHWVKFQTGVSKRYNFAAPVFLFWYEMPVVFGNSVFESHENREYYKPGSKFGFTVATDFVPWEISTRDAATDTKSVLADFTVSIGANFFHQMKGMDLSELSDFIGLTTVVDQHSGLSAFLDLSFMPTKYVRFSTGITAGYVTDHLITNQSRGIDTNGDADNDGDVLEDTELDPMYKDNKVLFNSINSVGSRVLATETLTISSYFKVHVQF